MCGSGQLCSSTIVSSSTTSSNISSDVIVSNNINPNNCAKSIYCVPSNITTKLDNGTEFRNLDDFYCCKPDPICDCDRCGCVNGWKYQ
jgi:hypothetical protein